MLDALDSLDLSRFSYVSIHAPSRIDPIWEAVAGMRYETNFRRTSPSSFISTLSTTCRFGDNLVLCFASKTWINESRLAEQQKNWIGSSRNFLRRLSASISATRANAIQP